MMLLAVIVGKALRFLLRLRGGGSAVPGRVALLIAPKFLERTIGLVPRGAYFVSGSNGKSTTTSMLVRVLTHHGLKVLTNPAGGNLPQGLASAVIPEVGLTGGLRHDIAVLEVDEAYGKLIAQKVAPTGLLITNLQLDQLNRFHSPEEVFGHLEDLATLTKDLLVVNGSDANTERLAHAHLERLNVFGVYASDAAIQTSAHGLLSAQSFENDDHRLASAGTLVATKARMAELEVAGSKFSVELPSPGLHYAIDSALAISMAAKILGTEFSEAKAADALKDLAPVYGRGEVISYKGQFVKLIMMKNLPSLQANLDALDSAPKLLWISVDEGTPDPSWIYDIDLRKISHADVISGTKTFQWATRLAYEDKPFGKLIEDNADALKYFLSLPGQHKTAILNYEQMMWLRKALGRKDLEGGND